MDDNNKIVHYFIQNQDSLFSDFDVDIISLAEHISFNTELFPRDIFPKKTFKIYLFLFIVLIMVIL